MAVGADERLGLLLELGGHAVERAVQQPDFVRAGAALQPQREIALPEVADFDSPTGRGALGTVEPASREVSVATRFPGVVTEVHVIDGHDIAEVTTTLRKVKADENRDKPVCIIAKTIKGKGVSYMETEPGWHLGYLDPEDAKRAIAEIEAKEI